MRNAAIWTGIRRGLQSRCPVCGRGHLFSGFLKVRPACDVCGADNTIYPSDDMPAYLTILLVGHLVIPLLFLVDRAYEPAMWLQFAIWLPLTAVLSLSLLGPVKGAVIGLCWATGIIRSDLRLRAGPGRTRS